MPATLKQNCSYRILEKFKFALKTEAAFWLKFLELSDEEKKELLDYYELDDENILFSYILKFWNARK